MKEYGEENIGRDGEKSDLPTHVGTRRTGERRVENPDLGVGGGKKYPPFQAGFDPWQDW